MCAPNFFKTWSHLAPLDGGGLARFGCDALLGLPEVALDFLGCLSCLGCRDACMNDAEEGLKLQRIQRNLKYFFESPKESPATP